MEKLVPTIPKKKLNMANVQKFVANGSKYNGIELRINKQEYTGFPPNLSVRIPMGSRITEPVKIGIPRSHPISTTLHSKMPRSFKKVTNTPLSVQQAKQTMKANVLKKRMRWDCERSAIENTF